MNRFWAMLTAIIVATGTCLAAPSRANGKPGGGGGGGGSAKMGRLRTIGFEVGLAPSGGLGNASTVDGVSVGSEGAIQSVVARSGSSSFKIAATSFGGRDEIYLSSSEFALGRTYFFRAYFRFESLPTTTFQIMDIWEATGPQPIVYAQLTTGGKLQLFNAFTATQIGSDSVATISPGVWYRIELSAKTAVGAADTAELLLDGVSVANATGLSISDVPISLFRAGTISDWGSPITVYIDDIAINDDQGATQNSWPGEGSVVLLKPISDAQVGSWTGGVGGVTNLWDAINNTPPVGTATETNTSQIESADSSPDNSTDEYRANMTSYTTAGIGAADTITLCQTLVDHGEDVATGTKTGSFLILSNPAQVTADTFTFGDDLGLLGTWPSNWRTKWGAAQVGPTVVLGTSPVLRLRKVTTSTAVGSVDFAGIYVEYVPALVAVDPIMQPFGDMMFPVGP